MSFLKIVYFLNKFIKKFIKVYFFYLVHQPDKKKYGKLNCGKYFP